MGNTKRVNLLSFTISLGIHLLVLLAISINQVLSGKTYQVVNVVPISFDTEVESNILGVKPVKGKRNGGAPKTLNAITGGNRSFRKVGKVDPNVKENVKRTGAGEKVSVNPGAGSSLSKLVRNLKTGRGRALLKLSVELPNRKGKDLPSISSSRLVPYLIRVRDTIMKNWKVPYYTSSPKNRRTTIVITLRSDGTVDELTVEKLSPDITFNRSAISAIYSVKSFGPFPKGVKEKKVRLKVNFEVK